MEDASPEKKTVFLLLIKSISKSVFLSSLVKESELGNRKKLEVIKLEHKSKQMPHTLELCLIRKCRSILWIVCFGQFYGFLGGDQRCFLKSLFWMNLDGCFSRRNEHFSVLHCLSWSVYLTIRQKQDKDIRHRSHIDLLCVKIKHIEWVLIKKRSEFHFS